jgi:hypothetical protein
MFKHIGVVPAASVLITVFNVHHAIATEDCIAAPTHQPPRGHHWYYQTDQARSQKCWHLGEDGLPTLPRQSRVKRPGLRVESALSQAQRDALFQEFLRWRTMQVFENP